MTNEEQRTVAAAIERAHRQGIRVVTTGVRNDTGGFCWLVSSASRPNLFHVVSVADERHLMCDCKAAEFGRYCFHRAVVRESLLQAVTRATESASKKSVPTESEAILARNDKAFSLFRAE